MSFVSTFVASDVGCVRRNNEDSCAVSAAPGLLTRWRGDLTTDGGWALVADGLGGHAAGEIASALAIEILRPLMSRLRSEQDVEAAILSADTALYLAMEQQPQLKGMGTTIAGVVVHGKEALAFNVGDSRIYSLVDGVLTQLSTDDLMRPHQLTQCLGGSQVQVSLKAHVVRCAFLATDTLVLCSDGLTDMLPDHKICEFLTDEADPAAALVDAAVNAGGHDNVTVAALRRR